MRKLFLCLVVLMLQAVYIVAHSQSAPSHGSLFRFIINRGEVFSANAPGELTELTLSGYFYTNDLWEGQLTPFKSANSVTLTGKAVINEYSAHLQTKVVSSLSLPSVVSPTGMFLTLVVDGVPMSVQLPYVNESDGWVAGFIYTYSVTVEGRGLTISGVTCSALTENNY